MFTFDVSMREKALEALGLKALPPEAQDKILQGLGENVTQAIMLAILEKLPVDVQEEYKRLVEAEDADGVEALTRKYIPNYEQFIEEETKKELAAFKETLDKNLAANPRV